MNNKLPVPWLQFWDQPKVDHKSELTSLTLASPIHHCVLDIQGREKRFANFAKLQAGPGRKAKQGQEEISRNHVQRLFSALNSTLEEAKCVVKVGQF